MQYRRYTKNDVVNITREAIHLFIQKHIDKFVKYLDENFVFIGDYPSLFLHGIPEFLDYIREERELPPVDIAQEEYEIIAHERHLWTSCGRYIASLNNAGSTIVSKHHFTFTWKQTGHDLKLIHAMACHAKDEPAAGGSEGASCAPAQAKIFESDPQQPPHIAGKQKISIRDLSGKIRYLYADEIIYIKADDKICHIYTESESFAARITLNRLKIPDLIPIHKSYRVNRGYIKEICRYQATLTNGAQLPIGKSRYMDVKKSLDFPG